MIVLGESRYRVFGSPTFAGNPVTLFEVAALDDSSALLDTAGSSSTEDNVFFTLSGNNAPVNARYFSSSAELWLCGHGLLALSHHLHASSANSTRAVHAPAGTCSIYTDAQGPGVLMPAQQGIEVVDPAHSMKQALRRGGIAHERLYQCPNGVWIVTLHTITALLDIDAEGVATLSCGDHTPGALIAATPRLQDAMYGFRYFAPWHGKPEDSGTGSAHCYLAPLLAGADTPVTALQFSPAGMAEMRICLRDGAVALSGSVAGS